MPEGREIERQFRLLAPACEIIRQARADRSYQMDYKISQSYLQDTGAWTIRARKTEFNGSVSPAYEQTLKRTIEGIERIEEPINLDADGYARLLRHCGPTLHKQRTEIRIGDLTWEIDVFLNPELTGLELVEVELPSRDFSLILPDWVGEETSHLPQYRNAQLARVIR